MRIEEVRQQFQGEFVLIAVTKTDEDNIEIWKERFSPTRLTGMRL